MTSMHTPESHGPKSQSAAPLAAQATVGATSATAETERYSKGDLASPSSSLSIGRVLQMQQTIGNRAVSQFMAQRSASVSNSVVPTGPNARKPQLKDGRFLDASAASAPVTLQTPSTTMLQRAIGDEWRGTVVDDKAPTGRVDEIGFDIEEERTIIKKLHEYDQFDFASAADAAEYVKSQGTVVTFTEAAKSPAGLPTATDIEEATTYSNQKQPENEGLFEGKLKKLGAAYKLVPKGKSSEMPEHWRTLNGKYEFAVLGDVNNGGIKVSKKGHYSMTDGGDVLYAGEVSFSEGTVTSWNNKSGHYMPGPEDAASAPFPFDKFTAWREPAAGGGAGVGAAAAAGALPLAAPATADKGGDQPDVKSVAVATASAPVPAAAVADMGSDQSAVAAASAPAAAAAVADTSGADLLDVKVAPLAAGMGAGINLAPPARALTLDEQRVAFLKDFWTKNASFQQQKLALKAVQDVDKATGANLFKDMGFKAIGAFAGKNGIPIPGY